MPPNPNPASGPASRRFIAAPTDLAAGIFLLVVAVLAWWFAQNLKVGTAYRMGPGYAPIMLSWIAGGFGAVLVLTGLLRRGPGLERWSLKPMALVLGAMVVFGLCIERTGLLVASALAVGLSGLAAPSPRVREIVILALCMAAFACLLFPFALNLPLKIFP